MTQDERLEKYADLVVRVGANVQHGQDVVLTYQIEHALVARAVARAAYQAGARRVHILPADLHIRKAAIEFGPEEELGVTPGYLLEWAKTWRDTKPAIIQLTGNPDPGLFAGLDPKLVGKAEPKDLREVYLPLVTERLVNWVIVPAPNEGWARTVLGEPDVERLWQAVATAMRLNEDDPVRAWQDHAAALRARANASLRPAHSTQRRTGQAPGQPHRSQTGGAILIRPSKHLSHSDGPGAAHTAHREGSTSPSRPIHPP